MERWIEKTYIYRTTVHSLKDSLEVCFLIWQQLGQCFLTPFNCVRKNHLTHSYNLLILEEHVFCTCKTNTLCSKRASYLCIMRSVCIGANLQLGVFIAEIHQFLEVATQFGCLCGHLTSIDLTCGTIQRDIITFLIYCTIDFNSLRLVVNIDATST